MEWVTLYELADDITRVQQMQKVALDESTDMGLSVQPALVGSDDWWRRVDAGELQPKRFEDASRACSGRDMAIIPSSKSRPSRAKSHAR